MLTACGGHGAPTDRSSVEIIAVAPGLSPEEVDLRIVEPMLAALAAIDADADAVAEPGRARIFLRSDRDPSVVAGEARPRLAALAATLPPDLEPPMIERVPGEPYRYVLTGALDQRLTELQSDRIDAELQRIAGVSAIGHCGGAEEELAVEVDPARLAARGVDLAQVISVLESANVELPSGRLATGPDVTIRAAGDGALPVMVADVARITRR
ncbi:MAG TPA: efflux RND transporter permease subunit, partial [Planctomycetota bacterium]|nr:efflux RND transporter permease subunit [Planctomycetota bacterium]